MRSCAKSFYSLNDASCFNWTKRFHFLCAASLNEIFTNSPVDLEQKVDINKYPKFFIFIQILSSENYFSLRLALLNDLKSFGILVAIQSHLFINETKLSSFSI